MGIMVGRAASSFLCIVWFDWVLQVAGIWRIVFLLAKQS